MTVEIKLEDNIASFDKAKQLQFGEALATKYDISAQRVLFSNGWAASVQMDMSILGPRKGSGEQSAEQVISRIVSGALMEGGLLVGSFKVLEAVAPKAVGKVDMSVQFTPSSEGFSESNFSSALASDIGIDQNRIQGVIATRHGNASTGNVYITVHFHIVDPKDGSAISSAQAARLLEDKAAEQELDNLAKAGIDVAPGSTHCSNCDIFQTYINTSNTSGVAGWVVGLILVLISFAVAAMVLALLVVRKRTKMRRSRGGIDREDTCRSGSNCSDKPRRGLHPAERWRRQRTQIRRVCEHAHRSMRVRACVCA